MWPTSGSRRRSAPGGAARDTFTREALNVLARESAGGAGHPPRGKEARAFRADVACMHHIPPTQASIAATNYGST
jgi:hypothetical protein